MQIRAVNTQQIWNTPQSMKGVSAIYDAFLGCVTFDLFPSEGWDGCSQERQAWSVVGDPRSGNFSTCSAFQVLCRLVTYSDYNLWLQPFSTNMWLLYISAIICFFCLFFVFFYVHDYVASQHEYYFLLNFYLHSCKDNRRACKPHSADWSHGNFFLRCTRRRCFFGDKYHSCSRQYFMPLFGWGMKTFQNHQHSRITMTGACETCEN